MKKPRWSTLRNYTPSATRGAFGKQSAVTWHAYISLRVRYLGVGVEFRANLRTTTLKCNNFHSSRHSSKSVIRILMSITDKFWKKFLAVNSFNSHAFFETYMQLLILIAGREIVGQSLLLRGSWIADESSKKRLREELERESTTCYQVVITNASYVRDEPSLPIVLLWVLKKERKWY